MAYFPPTGSTVAFQSNPSVLGVGMAGFNPSTSVFTRVLAGGNLDNVSTDGLLGVQILSNGGRAQVFTNNNSDGISGNSTNNTPQTYSFNGIWNAPAARWNRMPGNASIGALVSTGESSVISAQYLVRNDNVASFLGANLTQRPAMSDSAGRTTTKPFAPEEARIEGYGSTVNVSVTTLVAAAGAGLRNYITDIMVANTGAAATLVTFKDGAASVLGYTIAPAGGGSNMIGFATPMRTGANATFDFQATTGTSVLYATVKGFKAP